VTKKIDLSDALLSSDLKNQTQHSYRVNKQISININYIDNSKEHKRYIDEYRIE